MVQYVLFQIIKALVKHFESPGDGNLESLQRAYGDELIVLESIDQFSEDERKIISEITKKDSKPRYDRDTWVTRSY